MIRCELTGESSCVEYLDHNKLRDRSSCTINKTPPDDEEVQVANTRLNGDLSSMLKDIYSKWIGDLEKTASMTRGKGKWTSGLWSKTRNLESCNFEICCIHNQSCNGNGVKNDSDEVNDNDMEYGGSAIVPTLTSLITILIVCLLGGSTANC